MAKKRTKKEKEELIRGYPAFEAALRNATVRILISLDKLIDDWECEFIIMDLKRMGKQNKKLAKRFIGEARRARSILENISLPKTKSHKELSRLEKIFLPERK